MGKRKQLLRTIQSIMKEKYIVGKATLVDDIRNSIDILSNELRLLYEAVGGMKTSIEKVDTILKANEEKLCEICRIGENDKYETLQHIYETAFCELKQLICDKELQIYSILAGMMFSKIYELEDLLDCDMSEIDDLGIEQVTDIVSNAIDKLVDDFVEVNDEINYFDKLIFYIREELEK